MFCQGILFNSLEVLQVSTIFSFLPTRQPATMPLFTAATAESLQKLLSVIHTALQTPALAVVLSASTTLSCLLWYTCHVLQLIIPSVYIQSTCFRCIFFCKLHLLCMYIPYSTRHLPSGFPLPTLLPLLSLLLHLVELHVLPPVEETHSTRPPTSVSVSAALTFHPLQLLTTVLTVMENMTKFVFSELFI